MGGSGENDLGHRHSRTRIGHFPDPGGHRQSEVLTRQSDNIFFSLKIKIEREKAFKEEYGEELADYATAYVRRGTMGPRSPGLTFLRGNYATTDNVRSLLSTALIRELNKQPSETRSKWMEGFLKELEQVYTSNQPNSPQS